MSTTTNVAKDEIRFRETFYRLVISQLFYDGYQSVAVNLSNLLQVSQMMMPKNGQIKKFSKLFSIFFFVLQTTPPCPPSDRLMQIVKLGIKNEEEAEELKKSKTKSDIEIDVIGKSIKLKTLKVIIKFKNILFLAGLDFDYESDKIPLTPDASLYETCYVTSHKAPGRSAAFDPAGAVIATGSVDASIKILDVDR